MVCFSFSVARSMSNRVILRTLVNYSGVKIEAGVFVLKNERLLSTGIISSPKRKVLNSLKRNKGKHELQTYP